MVLSPFLSSCCSTFAPAKNSEPRISCRNKKDSSNAERAVTNSMSLIWESLRHYNFSKNIENLILQTWRANLVAVIRSIEYHDENVKYLDKDNELTILSTIAATELQTAYSEFVSCFKLDYFIGTIQNIHHLRLERTIRNKLIIAVTGIRICNDKERLLISLSIWYDGLTMPIFYEITEIDFMTSCKITSELTTLIQQQSLQYNVHEDNLKKLKTNEKNKSVS